MPKRYGNLFPQIVALDNLRAAHRAARRGKGHYREVRWVNSREERLLRKLRKDLASSRFSTSPYTVERRWESGKIRVIHKLPYFPDRVVHHAICRVCNPIWERSLIRDTFQSIPGRGISDARRRVARAINRNRPRYALQLDIEQFYPSVRPTITRAAARRKIKCPDTLALLDDIIDSQGGLPLGNYTSQILGNLVLSPLDWRIKQEWGVRGYFRYCDDLVLMGDDPEHLEACRAGIESDLGRLGLALKPGARWVDFEAGHGLDFCGYVFRPGSLRVRPRILDSYRRAARAYRPMTAARRSSLAAYWGWVRPAGGRRLWQTAVVAG